MDTAFWEGEGFSFQVSVWLKLLPLCSGYACVSWRIFFLNVAASIRCLMPKEAVQPYCLFFKVSEVFKTLGKHAVYGFETWDIKLELQLNYADYWCS